MKEFQGRLSAKGRRFAIILPRFNEFIGDKLLDGALDCLRRHDADENRIEVYRVPGSFEIPYLARRLADSKRFNAIVCLGAVIRGDTPHFDLIAREVAKGIAHISMDTGIPAIFGIITADTQEQAIERAGSKAGNRGWDAAISAMEMADLLEGIRKQK
ncbi:MAG: 6,7-dimethyl-8-ribityllumazine synthase [bacterium]